MEKRELCLGWKVSELAFGAASISGEGGGYGFGGISENESIKLVRQAKDKGINLFDTAPIYGFGLSEERIGLALKEIRQEVYIVSKSGVDWHPNGRVNRTNDPDVAERMLNESLTRLQTDYIDLYMIHWPDSRVDIRDCVERLSQAKSSGKIREIGLCNCDPEELKKAQEVCKISVLQNPLNLFERETTRSILPVAEKERIGFMSYGTLGKGILTGRVTKSRVFDEHDARSKAAWWKKSGWQEKVQLFEKIDEKFLKPNNHSGLELSLSYNLSFKALSTALVGVRSEAQLNSSIKALGNRLAPSLLEEIVQFVEAESAKV